MISLPSSILKKSCDLHVLQVARIINCRITVLQLCLDYYSLFGKVHQYNFIADLKKINANENEIVQAINWFLKKSSRAVNGKTGNFTDVRSINKIENFFINKNRVVNNDYTTKKQLKKRLDYFSKSRINNILGGLPEDILIENDKYKRYFQPSNYSHADEQSKRLIKFLFDYDEFSKKDSIFTPSWGAYKLTESLGVRSCLYCNRNYILTVFDGNDKLIRAELDHFFFKKEYPLLAISFYNLIPSCHICNSNLKLSTTFSLLDNFHPYLGSYEDEKVQFTYKPKNARAFFNDNRNLEIKLYKENYLPLQRKIVNNNNLFQLEKIYNQHIDTVESLLKLQRKTNKNWVKDIYKNVLKDSKGACYFNSEKEIYEFAIRNYYSSFDFHKKPLAKFERDIAKELGLIK